MSLRQNKCSLRMVLLAAAAIFELPSATPAASQVAQQINLVTDNAAFLASQGFTPANTVDPNLINPWGMSFGPTTPFWTSNQGTGTTTLYGGNGTAFPLVVTIPSSGIGRTGPTGQVFAVGSGFSMGSGNAAFVFANLDGSISAWNGGMSASVQATTPGAVYTGLALGSTGAGNLLYAANNAGGTIDVFDQNFQRVLFPGSFVDPNLPAGFSPFNVANIGGQLFVTYAEGGPNADEQALGSGIVDVYSLNGLFLQRFATGGNLLSPWGIAVAPNNFDGLGGDILIGNFSNQYGFINVFDPGGGYLGRLTMNGEAFNMPYLWSLASRTGGPSVDPNALYITSGIGDERHGLFAELLPVPEPSTWAMMLAGFGALGAMLRVRGKPKREVLTS